MNDAELVQGIADTLQRVYGDATQTVLDHKAASEVWKYLQSQGVASWPMVAAVVQAAGGEITIPSDILLDPPNEMTVTEDRFGLDSRTIKVRYRPT